MDPRTQVIIEARAKISTLIVTLRSQHRSWQPDELMALIDGIFVEMFSVADAPVTVADLDAQALAIRELQVSDALKSAALSTVDAKIHELSATEVTPVEIEPAPVVEPLTVDFE